MRGLWAVPLVVAAVPLAVRATSGGEARDPQLLALLEEVKPAVLQATVAKLVSFGTRHSLSDTTSPRRGIGAARTWLASEMQSLARLPGSRLKAFEDRFVAEKGPRIPAPVEIVNVGVLLPAGDPARAKEAIVLTGHYDSRASDALDARSDAPGAVDDGSGVAIVLALARAFAGLEARAAVYFVAVAGEEQGLLGSTHLAARLRDEGVKVIADVSVDIAGNSEGQDGIRDSGSARLFSEGVAEVESEAEKKLREAIGAENDGRSREWARYVKRVGESYVEDLELVSMLRRDRIARGTDNRPFVRLGAPGIRVSEAHEHYDRQHQDVRVENGRSYGDDLAHFDAAYAARIGRALGGAIGSLARAPAPPVGVALGGAVSPQTRLRWTLPNDPSIAGIVVYRRRADSVRWQRREYLGKTDHVLVPVVPDSFFFAVATVDAEGHESIAQPPSRLE